MIQNSAPSARPDSASDNGAAREAAIERDCIARLFYNLPNITLRQSALPLFVLLAMWGHVCDVVLVAWTVSVELAYLWRYLLARVWRRSRQDVAAALRTAHHFTITSIVVGVLWGSATFLLFVPDSTPDQVFLLTVILATAAGSLIVTSYWLPAFYAYAVPALLLTAARLALEGGTGYVGLAIGVVVYLSILRGVARNQSLAARNSVRLRFENLDLVDDLKQQKKIAEDANRAKSMFLASASHDLRQPLHALGLFVSGLGRRTRDKTDAVLIHHIQSSVAAMGDLFNALLDISRLDAGIVRPEMAHVELAPLLDRLTAEQEPIAERKGLALKATTLACVAYTDLALLEIVLRNLLVNATRYTHNGHVSMHCYEAQGRIVIEVEDSGIGIPAERQADIFGEFVQLNNPERDRTKGLGLGLAIVRRLAFLLDLGVEVRSAPGAGSTFTVRIPAGDASQMQACGSNAFEAIATDVLQDTGLVLVVDDERSILEGTRALLEEWGYTVYTASSEDEALTLVAHGAIPDVLVCDYRLRAGRTGVGLFESLKNAMRVPLTGIIITGDTGPECLREVEAADLELLHKPLKPARLRVALRNTLRRRQLRNELA
jgi:signal transduction histidine kinase/ActR/RegA family two-component response regulator